MQGSCRLSLRWHQQFFRSPNFYGHQKCLQILHPARGYRQTARRKPSRQPLSDEPRSGEIEALNAISRVTKPRVVVNEYEQDIRNRRNVKRVDPNQELNIEIVRVREQMEKLEEELAAMKQGPFGPESEFMQSLPKDDREQLLNALVQEGILQGQENELLTIAELERIDQESERETSQTTSNGLGVTLRIPKRDQAYVRHFNKALRGAKENPADTQKNLVLWTWYLRCQQHIHNFSSIISDDVWNLLWQTQADLKIRPKHLVMLAQDMLAAGEKLEMNKMLDYIEALRGSRDLSTAVEVWQKQKEKMRTNVQHQSTYWNLGVKLFAELGRPSKAQEMAMNAIHQSRAKPQILIPVIIAWVQSQVPDAFVKAWVCYLKLRQQLGPSIQPSVFEEISNALLDAHCTDMALTVFKDMLLSEEQSSYDSQTVYKQAMRQVKDVMQKATTEERINHVGLSALLMLPRTFHNRFFFTSWIKKLIGEGRNDAAMMVVELMYERGITPDARPLNGIVGAWLREGSSASLRKAERLARTMIEARIDLVKVQRLRLTHDPSNTATIQHNPSNARRSVFMRRRVPPATIETFSIMVQYYCRRSNFAEAEELTNTMINSCQIKPNAFILNHWLYADLRSSKLQDVWTKYTSLTPEITPDLETFAALWDAAKAQYSRSNPSHAKNFPTARHVFAEMVAWIQKLPANQFEDTRNQFSQELYEQIIRCFCLSEDLPGALVALHGMHRILHSFPDDNSIRLICGSAARLLPNELKGRVRKTNSRHRHVLAKVADIVETIESTKKLDLVAQGTDALLMQEPSSSIARDLRLSVMTEFICLFMKQMESPTASYENDIRIAADTMGVDLQGVDLKVTTDLP